MKIICDRSALVELLNIVSGVIVARTPKPILRCVMLAAEADGLTLAATDLEMSIRISTPRVEVEQAGQVLVPCEKLVQIVRESPESTLSLQVDDQVVHIRGQDAHFQVYGQSASDFPPVAEFSGECDFKISAGQFGKLIGQTLFAAARETSRYAMNGVLLEREGDKLAMVGTDGRRLALSRGSCTVAGQAPEDGRHTAIVPTKALGLLQRQFVDTDRQVQVRVADNMIYFATDETVLASNLVEGNFPPYKDVVPKDSDRRATLNTVVFARALRRAALLTNEESKGVQMAFDAEGLLITSRAPEMGEAEVRAEQVSYDGEPIQIGFNPQFVLDALKVVESDQVVFEMKASNKPGLLRVGSAFVYVIMPVNLQ